MTIMTPPRSNDGRRNRWRRLSQSLALWLTLAIPFPVQASESRDLITLSLEQLLEVTIVGASKYEQKQSEVAAAVSVISRQEIKAYGWHTLADAVASLPGIYTTYDRQYQYLGMRGFGVPGDFNTRVLLTINGNRVNDGVYDQAYIGRDFPLDMDLIERIEFIPGPGGAVYGQNAMFGVVNVVTRNGASLDGTELAVSYQNPQSAKEGRVTWGKKFDNGVDMIVSTSGYKAKGESLFFDYGAAGVSGIAAGLDGERDKEFFTHLGYGPWSFDLTYGDRRKDDPTGVYLSDPLVSGTNQHDRIVLTQLRYDETLAEGTLHLSGRLFAGQERYKAPESYAGAPSELTTSSNWHGAELRIISTAWTNHKVMLGTELQSNTRQEQTFDDFTTSGVDTFIPKSGWRAGIFTQDEWTLSNTLSTTMGLRVDRNNVTGNAVSPRAALIWRAVPDTTLKALYGRAHRAPNVYEHDYADGVTTTASMDLNGETVDTMELVVDHRMDRDLTIRGSLYQWEMHNLITLGTGTGGVLPQYQNGSDIRTRGVELSTDKTWDWGGRLRGSLSEQSTAYDNGARLNNSPQLLGKLNFYGPLAASALQFGYELQYSSKRRAIDGTYLEGYWLSNINLLTNKLASGLEVSLGFYNLFNARYEHPGSRNNWQNALQQDSRSVRLKAVYTF
jgi:outer membrane receptor protein involved in Fe transport